MKPKHMTNQVVSKNKQPMKAESFSMMIRWKNIQ